MHMAMYLERIQLWSIGYTQDISEGNFGRICCITSNKLCVQTDNYELQCEYMSLYISFTFIGTFKNYAWPKLKIVQ